MIFTEEDYSEEEYRRLEQLEKEGLFDDDDTDETDSHSELGE